MVEGRQYKTKLCVLYKRGHCPRQSCSFAHGNAELRRFSGSFDGRRDYRGSDLRDRLLRPHSPPPRYSPRRDARGRQTLRGFSPSRSLGRSSERKRRKKDHLDDHSGYSGSLKNSDGAEDRAKERKNVSPDSRYVLEEQLKQVQLDIDKHEDHKCQLQIYLEERTQEADSLTSKIQELDCQLYQERDDSKRLTSKIKKFVRAHNRYLRIQDELKRSQSRLQKLVDQLGSEASRTGANGDDSSINIVSDGEPAGNHVAALRGDLHSSASPGKKRLYNNGGFVEETNTEKLTTEDFIGGSTEFGKKCSRWNVQQVDINDSKEAEVLNNANGKNRSLGNGSKHKRGNSVLACVASADKFKDQESGSVLPSTSMAAHALDEYIDVTEDEDKIETTAAEVENGTAEDISRWPLPLPPPPPVPKNAYHKYEDHDQNVNVDGNEEMADVDIV